MARRISWQLAESAGHSTPNGLQHLLGRARWDSRRDPRRPAGLRRRTARPSRRGTDRGRHRVPEEGHTTSAGRALVDRVLYLPKSRTDDRGLCSAAKVSDERVFATKNTLAATMGRRALSSPLPVAWVTADAAHGQDNRFRRMLEISGVGYVLAVPKSQFSLAGPRIDAVFAQAPDQAWERLIHRGRAAHAGPRCGSCTGPTGSRTASSAGPSPRAARVRCGSRESSRAAGHPPGGRASARPRLRPRSPWRRSPESRPRRRLLSSGSRKDARGPAGGATALSFGERRSCEREVIS
ncbi:transposase [Streptomyces sp. SS7]|uniref:transposase n=1 Tax=Streptomyces sp. SS7 TaxID=3108485 RepID=UPI0030ED0EE5